MAGNTAAYTGTSGVAKFDVADSATTIASVRNFTVDQVTDTIETSSMGNSAKTYLPGQTSFSGTLDLLFVDADAAQAALFAAIGSNPASLELYPSGNGSTGVKLSGEVIITGHSITVDQNDAVVASVTYAGTGALTSTTLS